MVKKLLLVIFMFLLATEAHAAYWIKYNATTNLNPRCRIGDGVKIGAVASYDTYDQPLVGWLASNEAECADASVRNRKVDQSIVSGSRVVDMTQAEIDAAIAAALQVRAARKALRDAALDDRIASAKKSDANLIKVDQAIDNIGNLNDAKVFLKKLSRYIATLD